jgi:hypothetical protein
VPIGIFAEPYVARWFEEHKFHRWGELATVSITYVVAVLLLWALDELLRKWDRYAERKLEEAAKMDEMDPEFGTS